MVVKEKLFRSGCESRYSRRQLAKEGFAFCTINFFSNRLFLLSVNMNIMYMHLPRIEPIDATVCSW
jgi:hypothetical protein